MLPDRLLEALKSNNTEIAVRYLVKVKEQELDLNTLYDPNQWKPIHWSVWHNNILITHKILTLFGVKNNINLIVKDNLKSPLHLACENNCVEVTDYLLSMNQADVNSQDKDGNTPLHICANKGFFQIAENLIENQASVNLFNNEGEAPLHLAIKNKQYEFLQYLYDKFDFNQLTQYGNPPLILAFETDHDILEFFEFLNQSNIELDYHICNANGFNALHFACKQDNSEAVKFLLSKQVDPNKKSDFNGYTPLMVAVENKNIPIIKILIENGAKPFISNNEGKTSLDIAKALDLELSNYLSSLYISRNHNRSLGINNIGIQGICSKNDNNIL